MNHTSSLYDNLEFLLPLRSANIDPWISLDSLCINYFTPDKKYYSVSNFSNRYAPGKSFNYVNIGPCVLALIIENLTGQSFDEYTRQNIFNPLSMNSTSWFLRDTDTSKLAMQYSDFIPIGFRGFGTYPSAQLRTNKFELLNHMKAWCSHTKLVVAVFACVHAGTSLRLHGVVGSISFPSARGIQRTTDAALPRRRTE